MNATNIEIKVPSVGESVKEDEITNGVKQEGETVNSDTNPLGHETEKETTEEPAPGGGGDVG